MASPFLGVFTAVYAYIPQGDQELTLEEGDLLYVLERSDDDWWKVKKKVNDSDDDEPIGLVPATYIEEVSNGFSFLAFGGTRICQGVCSMKRCLGFVTKHSPILVQICRKIQSYLRVCSADRGGDIFWRGCHLGRI